MKCVINLKMYNMKTNELSIYDEDYLKSKIYIIRGVQVMIDADLAEIYGYETRYFNRQVNNNIERFDLDARFQLTKEEYQNLMCKNFTSSWGGTRKLPYAFTELGIYTDSNIKKDYLLLTDRRNLSRQIYFH